MKNLKLSLKKEIISSLEAKNVVGGRPNAPLTLSPPDGPDCELRSVIMQCQTDACPASNACPTNITCPPPASLTCAVITPMD